jgi:N-acetylglucosamine malate deacetylase 1
MQLPKRILVLSPHPDDGELSAGGTIAREVREGGEVYFVVFTGAEKSLPPGSSRDLRRQETSKAMERLGVPQKNSRILNYELRKFPTQRQEILEDMLALRDEFRPDLVLAPSSADSHQDHQVINMEAIRAFKNTCSIWGYEHPWNNLSFSFDVLVSLSAKDVESKIAALQCHQSQAKRMYFRQDYLFSVLRTHGVQAGLEFAEVFELIRAIIH